MSEIQLGSAAGLYLCKDPAAVASSDPFVALNHKQGDPNPPATLLDFLTVTWFEMTKIGTSEGGASFSSVDTTTRESARTGFETELDTLKKGEIKWKAQLRTLEDDNDGRLLRALMYAGDNGDFLGILDLSSYIEFAVGTQGVGATGTVANWSLNYTETRDVKGVQEINFTAKLQEYSDRVEVYDNLGTPTLRRFQQTP